MSNIDFTLASNTYINFGTWGKSLKMDIGAARSNFNNPLLKHDKYDGIVVVLDTKKPCIPYKYPIDKPIYKSNTQDIDLSNISLNISLKQRNNIGSLQDDSIELDDIFLMKELNYEYQKIMQINGMFNSPNRTIKLKEEDLYNEVSRGQELCEPEDIPPSTPQSISRDDVGLIPLPHTDNLQNTSHKILEPVIVEYTVDESPQPKRLKLGSLSEDNQPELLDHSTDLNIQKPLPYTDDLQNLSHKITEPTIVEHTVDEYLQPKRSKLSLFSEDNQPELLDHSTDLKIQKPLPYTENLQNTSHKITEPAIIEHTVDESLQPKRLKLSSFSEDNQLELLDHSTDLKIDTSADFKVEKIVNNDDCILSSVSNKNESHFKTDIPNFEPSPRPAQNEFKQDTPSCDKKGDFVIFHLVNDQPSSSKCIVDPDYFLNDEYFEVTDKKKSNIASNTYEPKKGVKRRRESTISGTHKKARCNETVQQPVRTQVSDNSKQQRNWDLYNFSKPDECFQAVQNQWGCSFLPNPHEDLTCRFYNVLPKYNTHFTIPGTMDESIECLSVYENQITEIEEEVSGIQQNLDNFGSSMDKKTITRNLERRKRLNQMRKRLNDACDDTNRFYTHYRDRQTGWNAWHLSEYHYNEIKHQFNILDTYTDFYGFT